MNFEVWNVGEGTPSRLHATDIGLEKELEDWIETDPSLIQHGLEIVGRQFQVESGPIDLLAIDPQGRWVVIEIKRGFLTRQAIAQVIDYSSGLALMSTEELAQKANRYLEKRALTVEQLLNERAAEGALDVEEREILSMVVGLGKSQGLGRMVEYLASKSNLPISIVTFSAFQLDSGRPILIRERFEPNEDIVSAGTSAGIMKTVDEICEIADEAGVGADFRSILQAASDVGLYARPYKTSIMYTHPRRRNRMLFTVWAQKRDHGIAIYAGPNEFVEFFPLNELEVVEALGLEASGWHGLNSEEVMQFSNGLRNLLDGLLAST